MNTFIKLIKEQNYYKSHIFNISLYSLKSEYANHYLGVFWNVIQPLLQIAVYYIVFGIGLRTGGDRIVSGVPFILYLISGLFPWLFIAQGINKSSVAILQNKGLLSKMKFPSSVFLSATITNNILNIICTSSIIFMISLINELVPWWHYLFFLYFLLCSIVLIFSISLLSSISVVLIRDTKNLIQNIIRMLFFMTPIFWSIEDANNVLRKLINLNPISYLISIYRFSFVNNAISTQITWHDHLYFWILTLNILILGSIVHSKFKRNIMDYI